MTSKQKALQPESKNQAHSAALHVWRDLHLILTLLHLFSILVLPHVSSHEVKTKSLIFTTLPCTAMTSSLATSLFFSPSAAFEFLWPPSFHLLVIVWLLGWHYKTKSSLSHRSVSFINMQTYKGKEVWVTGFKAHTLRLWSQSFSMLKFGDEI